MSRSPAPPHSRTAKRLRLAAAAGALLLALAIPASASAAWSTPKYITPQLIPAELPAQVEMDSDGDSYLTYALSDGRVQAKKYSPTGASAWTKTLTPRPTNPEQELSAEMPNLGVNDAGDSAYAWLTTNNAETRSIVQARTLSASGTLGPVRTLADIGQSEGEIELPEVAVDADGDAVVAWTQTALVAERGQVKARTLSAGGDVGTAQTISQDTAGALAEFVQVGMQPDGDAVFAWQFSTNNLEGLIQTRTLRPSGTLTKIRNVSRLESSFPDFAMAPDGDAIFAWVYADPLAGGLTAQSRRMSADGTLGKYKNLSPRGGEAFDPEVALNGSGAAAAAWRQKDPLTGKTTIKGRTISGTDQLGQTLSLSGTSPEDATDAGVGISSTGRVVFSWLRFAGAADRVESKTLSPAGALGQLRTLDSAAKLFEPHLAVAASGEAAATWVDLDLKRIGASFGP